MDKPIARGPSFYQTGNLLNVPCAHCQHDWKLRCSKCARAYRLEEIGVRQQRAGLGFGWGFRMPTFLPSSWRTTPIGSSKSELFDTTFRCIPGISAYLGSVASATKGCYIAGARERHGAGVALGDA